MKRVLSLLFLMGLVLSLSAAAMGNPSESVKTTDPSSPLTVSKVVSPASQRAALAFWTRDEIAAAPPLALPVDNGPVAGGAGPLEAQASGEPGFVAPALAAPNADQIARDAYPDDWAALDATNGVEAAPVGPDGTSGVYTKYIVNQWTSAQTVYPHRWVGRVSFLTSAGTSYCSGAAISGNIMLTAAHCLHDSTNNVWYSSWVFSPAYRNGSAPYGTFAATVCRVLTTWVNLTGNYSISTWTPHDVGVCNMGNNSSGQTLNQAVGSIGRQWNQSVTRHFHDLGYPFNDYNNVALPDAGKYLRTCVAESAQYVAEVRRIGCGYGGGISGGPWMTSYAINVLSGYADGVNSGIFIGQQNIYAARFNDNNIVVLCNAAGC